jgi:uncharacterized protein (TIGR02391 family)
MNLQTHVRPELWSAISGAYESGNFAHAILDACHLLSNVLRDRAGVDGDGTALVGQALGGDAPRLRLNALQTESERNVQKGVEHMLRGIYIGIRNPRSHDHTEDTKETADAIIVFVSFLLDLLNSSREAFTLEDFLSRVRDSEFVDSERYADLMLSEIPAMKRADALIYLYKNRSGVDLTKRRRLVKAIMASLSANQLSAYLAVVSEDLRNTNEDATIRTALQLISPDVWPQISEISRLRIENKLITEIKGGEILPSGKTVNPLATWSRTYIGNFSLREEAVKAVIGRLRSTDPDARHYGAKFFLRTLPQMIPEGDPQQSRAINAVSSAVISGDENVRRELLAAIDGFPSSWQAQFVEKLKDQTDEANPATYLADGTPFLSSPADEDEIPF